MAFCKQTIMKNVGNPFAAAAAVAEEKKNEWISAIGRDQLFPIRQARAFWISNGKIFASRLRESGARPKEHATIDVLENHNSYLAQMQNNSHHILAHPHTSTRASHTSVKNTHEWASYNNKNEPSLCEHM